MQVYTRLSITLILVYKVYRVWCYENSIAFYDIQCSFDKGTLRIEEG